MANQAISIAQVVAKDVQQQAHRSIASIVQRCLTAVYDDQYRFEIAFVERRGKTEAVLQFVKLDGTVIDEPLDGDSGGVIEVAAFGARLANLLLARPVLRRILILDEAFSQVKKHRLSRIRQMVVTLAEELGVQFVIVTHLDELRIGKVIEV